MLSNRRLIAVCAIALSCNIAVLIVFVKFNSGGQCFITIGTKQTTNIFLPDEFLSIGIDTSEIMNNQRIDFHNGRLRELAAALAPARLRLGGTLSDRLIFSQNDLPPASCSHCPTEAPKSVCSAIRKLCKHKFLPFFIMTGNKWVEVNDFCKITNMRLLFSLNVLLRDHNKWNDANALDLIEFSYSKGYDLDWQLSNEPNSFKHVFNISLTPEMLSKDFKHLHHLLHNNGYRKSLLVGPDTTRPQPQRPECLNYMVEFLANASNYINVRSWHQYYLNSRTAKLEDFWNPETFDILNQQIHTMKSHTKKYNYIPMWLTETSSSYGGGAPGLSNSFAGSPLWVDKLGMAARNNITTVIRQSFIGGNYSLVNYDLDPLPDWWISVLFKKLVGKKVLSISCHCSQHQRMYAHCTNNKYTNDTSAITIYGINLQMKKATFLLNGTAILGSDLNIDEYIISAPSNNRRTKTILLNGWPLYYKSPLPEFEPRHIKYGNHISMPPFSIGFWVIRDTSIDCK